MRILPINGGRVYDIRIFRKIRLFVYKWFGIGAYKHLSQREGENILYEVRKNHAGFDYCKRWISNPNTLIIIHFKTITLYLIKRTKRVN